MPRNGIVGPPSTTADASAATSGAGRRSGLAAAAFVMTVAAACALSAAVPVTADPDERADRGAEIYAFSCAACHGATGSGFEEAVAAFPEDHRTCTRCHHPSNAPQMPGSQVGLSTMAFSLGDPPPLDGERLSRFESHDALFRYVRAAMPRWAPGSLDDEAYHDVTAHLLRMAGRAKEP